MGLSKSRSMLENYRFSGLKYVGDGRGDACCSGKKA